MIAFKPDGGNVSHEGIRLKRKPGSGRSAGTFLEKSSERRAVVDIKRPAFDAAGFRGKLYRCQSTCQG